MEEKGKLVKERKKIEGKSLVGDKKEKKQPV